MAPRYHVHILLAKSVGLGRRIEPWANRFNALVLSPGGFDQSIPVSLSFLFPDKPRKGDMTQGRCAGDAAPPGLIKNSPGFPGVCTPGYMILSLRD